MQIDTKIEYLFHKHMVVVQDNCFSLSLAQVLKRNCQQKIYTTFNNLSRFMLELRGILTWIRCSFYASGLAQFPDSLTSANPMMRHIRSAEEEKKTQKNI